MKPFEKIVAVRSVGDISPVQKLILIIIATHLGESDFAFLSLSTLQRECCIATRHNITDNIKVLIDKNYLIKKTPSDGYKSNRYGINFEKIKASAAKELVPQRNQTSAVKELDQCRKGTRLVPQRNPKRNINKIKRNIKSVSPQFSVDNCETKSVEQRSNGAKAIGQILNGLGKKSRYDN